MSVQALGWVFDHSPTSGSERLVLLSIANHAGSAPEESGGFEAWPGIETIAREAGISREQTVKRARQRLVEAGHLEYIVNGAPDSRVRADQRPNLYIIRLEHGVACRQRSCRWCSSAGGREPSPRAATDGGTNSDLTGGRFSARRGDASARDGGTDHVFTGGREPSPEPREEPSLEPREEPSLNLVAPPSGASEQTDAAKAPRSELREALIEALHHRPVTEAERGAWARAIRQLEAAGATPDEIRDRVAAYRRQWPDVKCTISALVRHWGALAADAPTTTTRRTNGGTPAPTIPAEPPLTPEQRDKNREQARAIGERLRDGKAATG